MERKPRVLRIINRFNLGGPTYNVAYLTKYMEDEFETLLVGGQKDASEDSSEFIVEKLGLNPIIIPEMLREINPKQDLIAYKKIKKLIREFKPDIVHTHASKAGAIGRLAAHSCNVPVILHTFHGHVFHSYFGKMKTRFYKKVEKHLAKKSTNIIAISELQREELSEIHKIAKKEKFKVIPLGFDLQRFQDNCIPKREEFRKKYKLKDGEVAIGIIGRLVPIKNHQLFLESIQYVLENTNKKIKAFIIGDGECRKEIENSARTLNISFGKPGDNLIFTSWIRDVSQVYPGLDIVALTSFNEGTPVSLIEAQAANKPIVSTNVGGIQNIVLENQTALLSDIGNDEKYAKNLLRLTESEQLRSEMSKLGWNHVYQNFSYHRLVKDMKDLYRQLL